MLDQQTPPGPAETASPVSSPVPSTVQQALAATPWLRGTSPDTLRRLARQAVLHRVPAGSMIFEQAETPAFAQFLIAGSVELLGIRGNDEFLVELVRPVDLLLPAAVLTAQPYLLRARVLDEATLLLVQAATFRQAVTQDHAFCLAVLACQATQFRRQVKQAKNVKQRSAEERVGCYLIRLAAAAPDGQPVRLPMEKRLIASELGMTRETFSRALGAMSRHGIHVDGDAIRIADPDKAAQRFTLDPLIDGQETIKPLTTGRTIT